MNYRVVFGDHDPERFGTQEFQADQLSDALFHVASFYSREPVELWCDDRYLGKVKHIVDERASYWRIE
jgi:hypothetical protein